MARGPRLARWSQFNSTAAKGSGQTVVLRDSIDKRACMFEPCPDLSNPSERFQTDSELLKNPVEQWRTDVPPAVDRYGHCPAIGLVGSNPPTTRLTVTHIRIRRRTG